MKTNKEFHLNGELAYIESILIIDESQQHLYKGVVIHPDGYLWIRVGRQAKYFDNGQLAWELNYSSDGGVLPKMTPSRRRDGTNVVF